MAYGKGVVLGAPFAVDGVEIAGADATALDLNVDVVIAKGLRLELILVEVLPRLGAIDLEAGELFGVRHSYDAALQGFQYKGKR